MENKMVDKLVNELGKLKEGLGEKQVKQLNLKLLERAIIRMGSYSKDCKECEKFLTVLKDHIKNLKKKNGQFGKEDMKEHRRQLDLMISHLQKDHKLVTEGYYVSMYMMMGSGVGLVLGLITFNNPGLGLPIGLCLGLAIGAALDASAKKKGQTI
jgi:hypothetical protein